MRRIAQWVRESPGLLFPVGCRSGKGASKWPLALGRQVHQSGNHLAKLVHQSRRSVIVKLVLFAPFFAEASQEFIAHLATIMSSVAVSN